MKKDARKEILRFLFNNQHNTEWTFGNIKPVVKRFSYIEVGTALDKLQFREDGGRPYIVVKEEDTNYKNVGHLKEVTNENYTLIGYITPEGEDYYRQVYLNQDYNVDTNRHNTIIQGILAVVAIGSLAISTCSEFSRRDNNKKAIQAREAQTIEINNLNKQNNILSDSQAVLRLKVNNMEGTLKQMQVSDSLVLTKSKLNSVANHTKK